MSASSIAGGSYAGRIIALLNGWPAVRTGPADCGLGVGVHTRAGQILHLHDESYATLRLTGPVIERLHEALTHAGRFFIAPDDDWIGMRLETPSDVTLLVTLVSLAIKANLGAPPPAPALLAGACGAGRRPPIPVAG
ncbi:MAG TPA: luciferase family protein [Streptosporangiaceae bacterium]